MTEHTPGPWIADAHFRVPHGGRKYVPVLRPGNDPVPLAVVHLEVDGYGGDQGRANASLIAAAPDMLLALQEVEQWADDCADVDDGIPNDAMRILGIVRTAIAKAIP